MNRSKKVIEFFQHIIDRQAREIRVLREYVNMQSALIERQQAVLEDADEIIVRLQQS